MSAQVHHFPPHSPYDDPKGLALGGSTLGVLSPAHADDGINRLAMMKQPIMASNSQCTCCLRSMGISVQEKGYTILPDAYGSAVEPDK